MAISDKSIVSLQDARVYLRKSASDTADDQLIDMLIGAASGMVAKELGVDNVVSTTYREFRDGQYGTELWLNNYPVTSVQLVSVARDGAMTVEYTGSDSSYATIEVTTTAVNLRKRVSGVLTSSSLALADYATLSALETAIEAVSGWTVVVSTDFASYSPTALVPVPAKNARDNAVWLEVPDEGETEVELKDAWGRLHNPYGWGYGGRGTGGKPFRDEAVCLDTPNSICVEYTAGYARGSVPEPIRSACLETVALLYNLSKKDAALKSETIGDYSYTVGDSVLGVDRLPGAAALKLLPYKRMILGAA